MEKTETPAGEKVYSIAEAAEYIGRSRGTFYQLRFYKRGPKASGKRGTLYTKTALDAWLAERGTSQRRPKAGTKKPTKAKTVKPAAKKAAKPKSPAKAKATTAKAKKDAAAKRAFAAANMRRPERSKKSKTKPVVAPVETPSALPEAA